jgi:hypothetical protein
VEKIILRGIWSILEIFVGVMRNVMIPSDRARRVVLGTTWNTWNMSLGESVVELLVNGLFRRYCGYFW